MWHFGKLSGKTPEFPEARFRKMHLLVILKIQICLPVCRKHNITYGRY
jgi:hypothetical protein